MQDRDTTRSPADAPAAGSPPAPAPAASRRRPYEPPRLASGQAFERILLGTCTPATGIPVCNPC